MYKFKENFFIFIISFILSFCIIGNSYAIVPSGSLNYQGIDVSNWQGYINYNEVKNAGIEVVYIKASQGSNIKDPYFEINYENAKAAGLKVGFYHFLTATNEEEAIQEANFFASVISGKVPDCKLVLDYEVFHGVGTQEINAIARAFMEKVKELTNKEIILYSDLSNARDTFNEELAQDYELWLAYYGDYNSLTNVRTNWEEYIGIQYSDRGRINGINANVDRDLFIESIFLSDENVTEINSSGTILDTYNTETVFYIVKSGNTLSQIASIYGTTVQEIAAINGITNVNLIFPGETLRIHTNSTINGSEDRQMNEIIYTVERGNTLSQIARSYNVTVESLVELNNIQNPNLIYPGEKIRIKESDSDYLNPVKNTNNEYYIVKSGDTLYSIARKNGTTVAQILQKNTIPNPNLIFPGQRIRL